MEHLWVEILGRNKYSKALVSVIYNSERILNPSSWLDSLESLLGHLTVSWDGMLILTGDVNIIKVPDHPWRLWMNASSDASDKNYKDNENSYRSLTNYPQKVTDTGVVPCSIISDHDAIYACIKRLKHIRGMKNFKEESFVEDFSTLPMSIISCSDDPDEQLESLNSLILECIERHAPLKRIRVTRPPAPWMKCPYIKDLQKERDTADTRPTIPLLIQIWTTFVQYWKLLSELPVKLLLRRRFTQTSQVKFALQPWYVEWSFRVYSAKNS